MGLMCQSVPAGRRRTGIIPVLLLLLALLCAVSAFGASAGLPGEQDYYSADGRLVFGVTPKADLADACTGELSLLKDGRLKLIWRHYLENRIAPATVLVANNGTVVTLDNWDSVGTGDTVLVIYAPDGKKRFSFSLEQLLNEQELRDTVYSTASSRWWRSSRPKELIDETGRSIIFTTTARPRGISLETGSIRRLEEVAVNPDRLPKPANGHRDETLASGGRYEVVGRLECLADCDSRDNWFIHLRPGARYPQRLRLTVHDIPGAKRVRGKNVKAVVHVDKGGDVSAVRADAESLTLDRLATLKELFETPVRLLAKHR